MLWRSQSDRERDNHQQVCTIKFLTWGSNLMQPQTWMKRMLLFSPISKMPYVFTSQTLAANGSNAPRIGATSPIGG